MVGASNDASTAKVTEVVNGEKMLQSCQIPNLHMQLSQRVALKLPQGNMVKIYSDFAYAVGILHSFAQLWEEQSFLTTAGMPKHRELIIRLLTAVQLPLQVAVIKCKAHTRSDDCVSKGNALVDEHAKGAIYSYPFSAVSMLLLTEVPVDLNIRLTDHPGAPKGLFVIRMGCEPRWVKLLLLQTWFLLCFCLSHGPCLNRRDVSDY